MSAALITFLFHTKFMFDLKTFRLLLLLTALLTVPAAAQQKPPAKTPAQTPAAAVKKFESKEGNFSINIAAAPTQVRSLASEAAQKKRIDVGRQFFWQMEKSVYTVMYSNPSDADGNPLALSLEQMNAGSRKGITDSGGKLIAEKAIAYGKHKGTEFRGEMPNGVKYIGRNYLIGGVGYLVTGAYIEATREKEVLDVMNSFKILVEKK